MKKLSILISALLLVLILSACNNQEDGQYQVYSFSGKNELFEITNGVIVLSEDEDIFDGGNLRAIGDSALENIKKYRAAFYMAVNSEQRLLLVDEFADMTEDRVNIQIDDLGRISGAGGSILNKADSTGDFLKNLWCSLSLTDSEGNEKVYTIPLESEEITQ